MKKLLIILMSLFLLAGCFCGCAEEPENATPEVTQATEENAPAESTPEESQAATPSATAPPATLPSGAPQSVKPQATTPAVTTPQATTPGATEPEATQPQPTKPQHTTVPAGIIIENLICTYSIGNGSEKTIDNPVASDLYQYLTEARSNAQKKNPTSNNNTEVIHISFKIGEKEIRWMDIYADDYAAIPMTVELPSTQFYLFPSGTYQTILNTLNAQ